MSRMIQRSASGMGALSSPHPPPSRQGMVQRSVSVSHRPLTQRHSSSSSLLPVTNPLPNSFLPSSLSSSSSSRRPPLLAQHSAHLYGMTAASSAASNSPRSHPRKTPGLPTTGLLNVILLIAVTCCVVTVWSSWTYHHHDAPATLSHYHSRDGLPTRRISVRTDGASLSMPPPPPIDRFPKDQPDKEPIFQLLRDAGIYELNETTMERLPNWSDIVSLYGAKPIMYGLDTCAAFQASDDPAEHFLSVAGTFNSGTNLLAELLIHNCHMPARMAKYGKVHEGIRWQVPWGKHTPILDEDVRLGHKVASGAGISADHVFPAVTIRDPAVWASSMCGNEYGMNWPHSQTDAETPHCPNFVPNDIDFVLDPRLRGEKSVPVVAKYSEFELHHDSLIHHWNEFYEGYFHQDKFPRLMVRFEDLIFHPKPVVQAVCECAGGRLKHEDDGQGFQYMVQSAKKAGGHGKDPTGYVEALVKYGNIGPDRWMTGGMTAEDRMFALQHLAREITEQFGYHLPTDESLMATS